MRRDLFTPTSECIVVDNASSDGTQDMLAAEFPDVIHLRTERNIGVAARNLGMQRARAEVLVTLDDDILGFD